ncbi:MAG: hypothetical protein RBT78_05230 [Kiritimatiellia bacterium]|jgi:UDP-N-acetylmuramyl pentapeptide phosphotransferase/UDP-N-acetylglucosamine-1-phosphate transferase|nr:hypothetical protein [Kiritimatiellia bacterium]
MTVNWFTEWMHSPEGLTGRVLADGAKYAGAFFGALAVSLVLTPLCREAARKIGMVDMPDARRINKQPVPRGGGLAIIVAFHLVLGAVVFGLRSPVSSEFTLFWQGHFLIASVVLAVIGLVDDRRGLKPAVKLAGQIVVAAILYLSGVHVGGIVVAFPPWLDVLVTVLWIVGAINAFNLIDGMDGLATGLALIASVGLLGALLFTGKTAATLPYLVLAGACLGFLRYNFHPASVFLGDTGSMFLGLCIATFPLMTGSRKELAASLGMPLLVMGVPLFDTLLAIWRRSVRALLPSGLVGSGKRVRVMQPDQDHVHHRLLRQTMNQKTAAIMLYVISGVLVLIGLVGTVLKGRAPGLFLIAFVVAVYVVVRHLERVELWDTGRLLSGKRAMMRQGLLVPLYIVWDVFALCGTWMMARWESGLPLNRAAVLSELPVFIVPVFVVLVAAKTYARVWGRAQVRDFVILGVSILAGTVIGAGLIWLFNDYERGVIRFALRFGTLAFLPVAGIRVWRDGVRGIMQMLERRILLEKPGALRFLAYGGGVRFRAYQRELMERPGNNDRVIVGILDDEANLKGRIIAGYPVLGDFETVRTYAAGNPVEGVIITCLMPEAKLRRVTAELEAMGLAVSVWACEERVLANPKGLAVRVIGKGEA